MGHKENRCVCGGGSKKERNEFPSHTRKALKMCNIKRDKKKKKFIPDSPSTFNREFLNAANIWLLLPFVVVVVVAIHAMEFL